MKVLLFSTPGSVQLDPAALQIDALELRVAGSLDEGLQALHDDHYDGVILDVTSLGDSVYHVKDAFHTTQSPACHLILGVSRDDDMPVDVLTDGVDCCIEFPLRASTLQEFIFTRQQIETDILQQRAELRRLDEEIATLIVISNIITSNLEFVPLLAAIAHETSKVLDADRTTIFLYDKDRNLLEAVYAEGLGPYSITLPTTQGVAGHVATTRHMINVEDVHQNPLFYDEIDKETGYITHNILSVPLISPIGDLIGVAECLNKRDGGFTKSDEYILSMLSPLYAVAIENALLYRDLQAQVHHNEQMTADKIQSERLAVVGRMANAVTKDIVDPMEEIVRHAAQLGRENLTPEERGVTCQAIERIVDSLVDMAQELLDFSRGSLELSKDYVTIDELMRRVHTLLENTATERAVTIDTEGDPSRSMVIDLDKFARSMSRLMFVLHQLESAPLSLVIKRDDDNITLTITPLSTTSLNEFMSILDHPFSGTTIDHDMGIKIAVAKRVIDDHGGTFIQQPDGLRIRVPATPTGG